MCVFYKFPHRHSHLHTLAHKHTHINVHTHTCMCTLLCAYSLVQAKAAHLRCLLSRLNIAQTYKHIQKCTHTRTYTRTHLNTHARVPTLLLYAYRPVPAEAARLQCMLSRLIIVHIRYIYIHTHIQTRIQTYRQTHTHTHLNTHARVPTLLLCAYRPVQAGAAHLQCMLSRLNIAQTYMHIQTNTHTYTRTHLTCPCSYLTLLLCARRPVQDGAIHRGLAPPLPARAQQPHQLPQ